MLSEGRSTSIDACTRSYGGVALALVILGLNLIGDALSDSSTVGEA